MGQRFSGEGQHGHAVALDRLDLFALEHPAQYRLMFGGPPVSPTGAPGAPRATFELVEELVRACQAQRSIRAGSSEKYARMTWAIVHGVASLALNGRFAEAEGQQQAPAREAVETVLVGVSPGA